MTEAMEKLTGGLEIFSGFLSFFCRTAASREGTLSGATPRPHPPTPPMSLSIRCNILPPAHLNQDLYFFFLWWSPAGLQTMRCVKESKYCREGGGVGGGLIINTTGVPKTSSTSSDTSVSADTRPLCQVKIHFTCCACVTLSITSHITYESVTGWRRDLLLCSHRLCLWKTKTKKGLFTLTKFECLIKGSGHKQTLHLWFFIIDSAWQRSSMWLRLPNVDFCPQKMPAPCGRY